MKTQTLPLPKPGFPGKEAESSGTFSPIWVRKQKGIVSRKCHYLSF
ncbi:hypothetical protein M083_2383 [Bacteroides fragilis str. 3986 T(B)9]|uniref:Uncharacterized protein n=1 Tax=Bacteroides fragilis str. 3998T(B)3 TaxID=1339316 RepID=A0A015U0W8_BACFG|nr:hypothetical protein M080_2278 [Bacteroides fragilis str. 3397 T10]EXY69914.1 hypothetical protein M083_2383 [Bacteroides fragilis str. 3986 T(B)9]EXY84303.1 hypothetical protein M079_2525 [Bacteroides fragilis str. 3996 N(B) 6]EXY90324.1 hypothetical protein M125_2948 [Bacteroides fragilis str. 3998T(B)3]EXY95223.1 hypothetical protein M081_2596 [Bacteroides fragilis str. 3998 T(B) 4]EXZ13810.1 hypothetical protein M071_2277 [Bacteroides fragilis str. Ds-233]EXZ48987.1 hypothetical protei